MKKKLTLLIMLLPALLMAQQAQDSVSHAHHKKEKKIHMAVPLHQHLAPIPDEVKPDFSKESIFKALFVAGMNLTQTDGDGEAQYRKVGALVGAGSVIKFSKRFSFSAELLYSMKGARPEFATYENGTKDRFDISTDYVDLPLTISVHDKKVLMFGIGPQLSVLARYQQTDSAGNNVTAHPPEGQQPRKVDFMGQVICTFFIKQRIGVGLRFAYSFLKIRDAVTESKLKGEYNNMISLRVSYLLDPKNPKWKNK